MESFFSDGGNKKIYEMTILLKLLKPFALSFNFIERAFGKIVKKPYYKSRLGYCGKGVGIRNPRNVSSLSNVYMYDNTNVLDGFTFMSHGGKFIMKKDSGASTGLTVITGNHQRVPCEPFKVNNKVVAANDIEKDIIVEEDVWIGANVTLCAGVTIGRCANIGAGCVVRNSIPPYAIVMGNPAKVVGFCFTPKEAAEHEKMFYAEEERIPFETLQKNYEKYFLKRIKDIKEFTRL